MRSVARSKIDNADDVGSLEVTRNTMDYRQQLVAETVASWCNEKSEHAELRLIGKALEEDSSNFLNAEKLAIGGTNHSFRLSVMDRDGVKKDLPTLFAKLSAPYALWHSDKSRVYDVSRTQCEFEMMETFHSISPGRVAKPLFCTTIDDMKLLVAEWRDLDEQWGMQFVRGKVDFDIVRPFAHFVAKLHASTRDKSANFNAQSVPYLLETFPQVVQKCDELMNSSNSNSRASNLARELGHDLGESLVGTCMANMRTPECLIHGDLQSFNILVSTKESSFCVCDWEMSIVGPRGKDLGMFNGWIIVCAVALGLEGEKDKALHLLDCLDLIWNEYSASLVRELGRLDDESADLLRTICRQSIGWTGWMLFLVYKIAGLNMHHLSVDKDHPILQDSIAFLGLLFLRWGFDGEDSELNGLGSGEWREKFRRAVWNDVEIALIASGKPMVAPEEDWVLVDTTDRPGKENVKSPHPDIKVHSQGRSPQCVVEDDVVLLL